jgi:zinc resistance-associated protein
MLKALTAGLVAAGLMVSLPALAQKAPETDGARGDRTTRMSPDDRAALLDARIAALRTGLKLTPDQEKNWPAVETALRDLAKQRATRAEQRREVREKRAKGDAVTRDPIELLRTRAEIMSERAAGLKRLADASEPLYRSLDDGQKRRLQVLARQAMGRQFAPRR